MLRNDAVKIGLLFLDLRGYIVAEKGEGHGGASFVTLILERRERQGRIAEVSRTFS